MSPAAGILADTITPFALSALKYGLFALLFLFIWRSMRWVVRGLSVAEAAPGADRGGRRTREPGPTLPPGSSTLLVKGQSDAKTRTVRLSASMTIGRGPECELRVDDTYASQQHARLFAKNNSWFVEDLGSTNGTFVNDQKLAAPAMLQPGDKVRVGQTIMELRR
ncbi:MAG TPA: FHA domain-containing protein [Actinomycetota bacterium]|nr:FHA domain-containing protein [Actinomycetota bacterium]